MTSTPGIHATDRVPTYLGRGDPAGRDYYPRWVENMAADVTLEGSMLEGAGEAEQR